MSESQATGWTRGMRSVARRGRTGATRCSAVQHAASGIRRVAAGACAYCTPTRRFRATRRSSSPSHSALLHRAACCTPACCTVRRVALRPVARATGRTPPCCTPGLLCAGTTRCSATRCTCGVLIIDWSHIRHGALQQTGPLQRVGVRLAVPCDWLAAVCNASVRKKLRFLDLNRGPLRPTLLSRPLH